MPQALHQALAKQKHLGMQVYGKIMLIMMYSMSYIHIYIYMYYIYIIYIILYTVYILYYVCDIIRDP